MYADTLFQFKKTLKVLDGLMVKAAAFADGKKFDVNVLASSRLAPDMLPFARQIQICSDTAKAFAANLSGQTAPKFEDTETTWTQLRERIAKTVTYLEGFKPEDFKNAANAKISPQWAEGQWLNGHDYMVQMAIPNFYFHVVIAYALLREAGVDIGKRDYLGDLPFKK